MKKHLSNEARLRHILEAIDYIQEFSTGKTKKDLYEEPIYRFAIERQLEIIGEAANALSEDLTTKYPADWRKIVAFRNFIVHEYFGVDLELVWDIIANKIQPLQQTVLFILDSEFTG